MIDHRTARSFGIHEDILVVCDHNDAQAAAIEVLSGATNTRLTFLRKAENADPEQLWLTLSYHDFYEHALGLYGISTLRKALEELEKRGFVDVRYVRYNGKPIIYTSYAAAQEDRQHTGEIIKEYRLCFDLVNQEIAEKFSSAGGDEARGGNLPTPSPADCGNSTTYPYINSTGEAEVL